MPRASEKLHPQPLLPHLSPATDPSDGGYSLVCTDDNQLRRIPLLPLGTTLPQRPCAILRFELVGPGAYVVRRVAEGDARVNRMPLTHPMQLHEGGVVQAGRSQWSLLSEAVSRDGVLYFGAHGLIGADASMVRIIDKAARMARSPAPVLVTGESGTGKEMLATALHSMSDRACKPFVAINCAALPEGLAEAELFGHMRGTFSGASDSREGLFERASGGTLFLDEIGELPLSMQAKLLRILDSGEVRRVGSREHTRVDVRVVSATNRDLDRAVSEGTFRQDLLYRLRVLHLSLPPLRLRMDDIGPLTERLLQRLDNRGIQLSSEALDVLRRHCWPGNVRELRNVLQRAAVLSGGRELLPSDLRFDPPPRPGAQPRVGRRRGGLDRIIFDELLRQGGHRQRTYEALGIPRSTFYRWVQRNRAEVEAAGLASAHGIDGG